MDITKIDMNFLKGSVFEAGDFEWRDILEKPFEIRGLAVHEGEKFCRLPLKLLPKLSEGVNSLAWHTAGGRVRFETDSPMLAFRVRSLNTGMMSHMPLTGSAGIDVYSDGIFTGSVRPANDRGGYFEGSVSLGDGRHLVEVNLPLYNGITNMYVGVSKGKSVFAPKPYSIDAPVVYYGSSITQGGCASRPGNSYQGFISRWLDSDHINLGFSGNGKGEPEMAEYIASLRMSAFVLDYDHNAPTQPHLIATHESFYKTVRSANKELPIVIVSRPDWRHDEQSARERRVICRRTYLNAVKAGDNNVYFIDGHRLFAKKDREDCTVDGTHPNDLGFYRMATVIYPVLKKALEQKK
ncbi:MAG: SGNH/GDSL hydrolase family protein [Clostridiales bacterium]|nr:SGNH/GDSL hydrolase family protein [Clostridiales bacterium]